MDLFELKNSSQAQIPLSEKMRPMVLAEVVGQSHLIGEGKPLTLLSQSKRASNMVLWGPPGVGKTTIARLVFPEFPLVSLSAVLDGLADLKKVIAEHVKVETPLLLFVDEIHRWNKAQQDSLLPHLESGRMVLIGATTENPSFSLIAPLLSRCKVYVLRSLEREHLKEIIYRASAVLRNEGTELYLTADALEFLLDDSEGDARRALLSLELASSMSKRIDLPLLESVLSKKQMHYDRAGETHYDLVSALIKSMRGSDVQAAIYYLARILEAGGDPKFLCRRLIIFAAEDVGLGDPRALPLAVAGAEAYDRVGSAEGWIPLSEVVVYLSLAPKSNSSYLSYKKAKEAVEKHGALPVPFHIRNAPTALMKELGYAKGYQYAHGLKNGEALHTHLPEEIKSQVFFEPTAKGFEAMVFNRPKNFTKSDKKH